jgi:selenocysteine lyase/cysteine desulfurase
VASIQALRRFRHFTLKRTSRLFASPAADASVRSTYEPGMIGFGEALAFHTKIGRKAIEERSRALGQALIDGLRRIDGVQLWTHADPMRSGAVVSFRPGTLDVTKLSAALYRNDRIGCATRGGADRPGIRFSPHIYNTMAESDRAVAAIARYMRQGV